MDRDPADDRPAEPSATPRRPAQGRLAHVSYHPDYVVALPAGHAFPMEKYARLHEILAADGLVGPDNLREPAECAWETLALAHDEAYLARLREGRLSRDEERRLGVPWSPQLVRRARLAVSGTISAALAALGGPQPIAANLAGGTHHALRDAGEGYCALNDVAVAIRHLRVLGRIRRALVVDLDVHHGNGTASIFAADPEVFTFSMHGARNFPLRKPPSTLDVALADGTGDEGYLAALEPLLPRVLAAARPDLAFYLAGVDVAAGDRFGRLALTPDGIARRDRLVLSGLVDARVPTALVLAGGYALGADGRTSSVRTAELHAIAHREAARLSARVVEGRGR